MRTQLTPVRRGAVGALVAVALTGFTACSGNSSHASKLPPLATTTTVRTTTTQPAAATTCDRPHASGRSTQTFSFDGVDRSYQLFVPRSYTGTRAVPVVFDFHGYGSNAREQIVYGNFMPQAERGGFLIVAPDGQTGPLGRHFNLSGEPGLQNDITMVAALLDHIEATFCVDARRVYSTGMSDGGAMTSVLACVMYRRFAAFGPVAVQLYRPGCGGTAAPPIMAFHGTADPVVPFDGGRTTCCGHAPVAPASQTMASWAAHNGCAAQPVETRVGTDVRRRTWTGCRNHGDVVFYIVDGGGHTWPGAIPVRSLGATTQTIDASALLWQFFRTHPLRAS